MELIILLALAIPLALPLLLTRCVLESTARSFADPRLPEAAAAVRRAALACVLVTFLLGLAFSSWCYYKAENYHATGFDLGDLVYYAGCFLPIFPIFLVCIGVAVPVRVKFRASGPYPGFSREL